MANPRAHSYKGEQYTFEEAVPEDLICPVCHEILNDPQQTECGHLFCQECISKVVKSSNRQLQQQQQLNPLSTVSGGLGSGIQTQGLLGTTTTLQSSGLNVPQGGTKVGLSSVSKVGGSDSALLGLGSKSQTLGLSATTTTLQSCGLNSLRAGPSSVSKVGGSDSALLGLGSKSQTLGLSATTTTLQSCGLNIPLYGSLRAGPSSVSKVGGSDSALLGLGSKSQTLGLSATTTTSPSNGLNVPLGGTQVGLSSVPKPLSYLSTPLYLGSKSQTLGVSATITTSPFGGLKLAGSSSVSKVGAGSDLASLGLGSKSQTTAIQPNTSSSVLQNSLGSGIGTGFGVSLTLGSHAWKGGRQSGLGTLGEVGTSTPAQLTCPYCKSVCSQPPTNDKYNERRVKTLSIHCPHTPCAWAGALCEIDNHCNTSCQFYSIPCENKCGVKVNRSAMGAHQAEECQNRNVKCTFCSTETPYCNLHQHYQSCSEVLLECPNKCDGIEPSAHLDMESHLSACSNQIVACTYANIGCKDSVKRKDLPEHKDTMTSKHLELALEQVAVLTDAFIDLKVEQNVLKVEQNVLKVEQNVPTQQTLGGLQHDPPPPPSPLPSTLMRRKWLQNDKLYPSLPWIVCFTNISQQQEAAIYSEPFFTGIHGYSVCLKLNRGRSNAWIGIADMNLRTCLLKGPNDHLLPWPYKISLSIEILNQVSKNISLQPIFIPVSGKGISQILDEEEKVPFMQLQMLHFAQNIIWTQYLKDDCLYVKVTEHLTVAQKLNSLHSAGRSFANLH